MKIKRRSSVSGIEHVRDIDVTEEQLRDWALGANIQEAMPNLPAEDREFLISGVTPEEWVELFNDED